MLQRLAFFKQIIANFLVFAILITHLWIFAPMPVLAKTLPDFNQDKKVITYVQQFSNMSSETFCRAYFDAAQDSDGTAWKAIQKGAGTIVDVANAILSASVEGAGALSGYAGIASVVSHLGLGSVTTSLAAVLGSKVAGAAATSVVTAAVGGPVVMGALLAGGAATITYGTHKLLKFSNKKFNAWAKQYCTSSANQPLWSM